MRKAPLPRRGTDRFRCPACGSKASSPLATIAVLLDAPEMIDRAASLALAAIAATAANYAYYLHVVKQNERLLIHY